MNSIWGGRRSFYSIWVWPPFSLFEIWVAAVQFILFLYLGLQTQFGLLLEDEIPEKYRQHS